MAKNSFPRSRTLLTVNDVLESTRFYCHLLDLTALGNTMEETHGNVFNRLYYEDELILQLHAWDAEGHPNMVNQEKGPPGHGVLIWFEIEDVEQKAALAAKLGASTVLPPATNPNSGEKELWLRELDGYTLVLSEPAPR